MLSKLSIELSYTMYNLVVVVGRQSTVYHHTYIVAYCQAFTVKVLGIKKRARALYAVCH